MSAAAPARRVKSIGQHQHELIEFFARDVSIWIGALIERQQLILFPILQRYFSDDLLRQYVERLFRHFDSIELSAPHRIEQRRAVAQLVARQREQSPLGRTTDRMPGAPD